MRLKSYILNESFIGNEVLPYMQDAIEDKIKIDTKEKFLKHLWKIEEHDKYVIPVIKYIITIDDKEYKELHRWALENR